MQGRRIGAVHIQGRRKSIAVILHLKSALIWKGAEIAAGVNVDIRLLDVVWTRLNQLVHAGPERVSDVEN